MMLRVKLTLYPNSQQRRYLCRLLFLARQVREHLYFELIQNQFSKFDSVELPPHFWLLPETELRHARKEVTKVIDKGQSGINKNYFQCHWGKNDFTLCDNLLHLTKPYHIGNIYFIAPLWQRKQLQLGKPIALQINQVQQQWVALILISTVVNTDSQAKESKPCYEDRMDPVV